MEFSDVAELGELQKVEAQLAELLAEDDVLNLAAAMEPGSTAGVLDLGEPLGCTVRIGARRSGGQLDRERTIPIQAIIASSRPMRRLQAKETEMPLRASTRRKSRRHRPPSGENRGRGQGGFTWPFAGCENRGSGRGRHAGRGRRRRI
jgi:hypothetical protein